MIRFHKVVRRGFKEDLQIRQQLIQPSFNRLLPQPITEPKDITPRVSQVVAGLGDGSGGSGLEGFRPLKPQGDCWQVADGTCKAEGDLSILSQLASTMVESDLRFKTMPGTHSART